MIPSNDEKINKTFHDVENTIYEAQYKSAIEEFIATNGADLSPEKKSNILKDPDAYLLFTTGENGLEVAFKG